VAAPTSSPRYAWHGRSARWAALWCRGRAEPEANGLRGFFSGKLPVVWHGSRSPAARSGRCRALGFLPRRCKGKHGACWAVLRCLRAQLTAGSKAPRTCRGLRCEPAHVVQPRRHPGPAHSPATGGKARLETPVPLPSSPKMAPWATAQQGTAEGTGWRGASEPGIISLTQLPRPAAEGEEALLPPLPPSLRGDFTAR